MAGSLWGFGAERVMHPFICKLCMPFRGFVGLSQDASQLDFLFSLLHTEAIATVDDVCAIRSDIYS